jgi:hypothetical protein
MNVTEGRYTMVSYGSGLGPAAGSCEHDIEPGGATKENLTILLIISFSRTLLHEVSITNHSTGKRSSVYTCCMTACEITKQKPTDNYYS